MKAIITILGWSFFAFQISAGSLDPWTTAAPREEIRPKFKSKETGGKSGHGALGIKTDEREGLHGWWQRTFSVTPGTHYRFSGWRRTENVAVPRRSVLARVLWRDEAGRQVQRRDGVVTNFSLGCLWFSCPIFSGGDRHTEIDGVAARYPPNSRHHAAKCPPAAAPGIKAGRA